MTTGIKTTIGLVTIGIMVTIGYFGFSQNNTLNAQTATFDIEGKRVTLSNGITRESIGPESSSVITTRYFGNEVTGDFNGDGEQDKAFLVTQNQGGSGTFFYLVTLLGGKVATEKRNAIFLGDRIMPKTVTFLHGKVIVTFETRNINEPMTSMPSVTISKYFTMINNEFVETKNDQPTANETITPSQKKIPFALFVLQNKGSYTCTVHRFEKDIDTVGTVYVSNGMARGMFTLDGTTQKMNVTFIYRDGIVYIWNSLAPTLGFSMKVDTATGAPQGGPPNQSSSSYIEDIGDYACVETAVDVSLFMRPTAIKFQSIH